MSDRVILIDMVEHQKTRDAASEALIELRKAMGKTQQTFAVEVLKTAIGTVARYETSDPPRGEVLRRLEEIARKHHLYELAAKFDLIYRKEMLKSLVSQLAWIPATETTPTQGHLDVVLPDALAVEAGQAFLLLVSQLGSADRKIKRNAITALSSLQSAVRRFQNPAVGEIQDTFPSAMGASHPPAPENKPQKKSKQSTKGTKR
jgi:transcriptional regulator with XRE-family HTH domain